MFSLFDTFVGPILGYNCELWGFIRAKHIECIHRKFCKWLLNVKMSTNSLALYAEVGRFPLIIGRQTHIVKYWLKLFGKKASNCLLFTLIMDQIREVNKNPRINNLANKVKHLLDSLGFADVWIYPESVVLKKFIPIFSQRQKDIYITQWHMDIQNYSSLSLYTLIKTDFSRAKYLDRIGKRSLRNLIAKLQLSSHNLMIKSGRHRQIQRDRRKCILCDKDDIEDKYHFIIICPLFHD